MPTFPYTIFRWHDNVSGAAPLASFIFYTAICLPSLVVFWRWRHVEPVRSRSAQLVIAPLLFAELLYMAYSVAMYLIYVNNDPSNACQLVFWITVIWPVTNYMPYFIRSARLFVQYTSGVVMIADNKIHTGLKPKQTSTMLALQRLLVSKLRWILHPLGPMILIAVVDAVTLAAGGVVYSQLDFSTPFWCESSDLGFLMVAQTILVTGIGTVLVAMLWRVSDGLVIRTEMTVLLLTVAPAATMLVLTIFEVVPVPPIYFVFWMLWCCLVFSVLWPLGLAMWQWRRRYQVDLNDSYSSGRITRSEELASQADQESHELVTAAATTNDAADANSSQTQSSSTHTDTTTTTAAVVKSTGASPSSAKQPARYEKLKAILADPSKYERLLNLAIKFFAVESVMFLHDHTKYVESFDGGSSTSTQRDLFFNIVNTYIEWRSPREINIDDDLRCEVLETAAALKDATDAPPTLSKATFKKIEQDISAQITYNLLSHWKE